MYVFYNPNPTGRMVEDCSIRAISKALDLDWNAAFAILAAKAYSMKNMLSANSVWGVVLAERGFVRRSLPDECSHCYNAGDFCADHPKGIYVLGFGTHVATVVDGDLYDSWNSSYEIPQYFWYRKEERKNDLPNLLQWGKLGARSSKRDTSDEPTTEL